MNDKENEYKEFIERNFPNSGVIENKFINSIYLRVCENNLITNIFQKYILKNNPTNMHYELLFLKRYQIQFNKILLYMPLNEYSGISFCVRSMLEYLLKFIYSIYINKSKDIINRCSFRHMKEDLNKLELDLEKEKEKLNILFNYYGKYSNLIHDKENEYNYDMEYMEGIITNNSLDLEALNVDLINILNIYETLISYIFEINNDTLALAEKIVLKNTIKIKRYNKIIDNLKVQK